MATAAEISADIKLRFGAVLSQNQVRQYLCVGSDKCREILEDVPYIQDKQTKRFFAIDVAKKLHSIQVIPKEERRQQNGGTQGNATVQFGGNSR